MILGILVIRKKKVILTRITQGKLALNLYKLVKVIKNKNNKIICIM